MAFCVTSLLRDTHESQALAKEVMNFVGCYENGEMTQNIGNLIRILTWGLLLLTPATLTWYHTGIK